MSAASAAYLSVKAAMSLKSNTTPVTIEVNRPRGTIYWGGAGLDGPYIADQLAALQEAGIQHVYRGVRTYSMPVDALRSGFSIRYRDNPVAEDWHIDGMDNPSPQFNLIGYSYGSLVAAQTAYYYAALGHIVDHLVLVGSPIDKRFLEDLGKQVNIRRIVIRDLAEYGDPIYAGIGKLRLYASSLQLGAQMLKTLDTGDGWGHFYFASPSSNGALRRRELARLMVRHGLK